MSDTKIQWADKVWNPVTGCTPISEGCANCYAARMARRLAGRYGYPKDEPFKPGTVHEDKFQEPYHWKQPQKVFVCSMGDLFHNDVPFRVVHNVLFPMFGNGRRHTYIILTKRPERMLQFFYDHAPDYWPLNNVWIGVTAENQRTADERIPILLETPAAKHFISVEPMLEPMDLGAWVSTRGELHYRISLPGDTWKCVYPGLDWVIAGPETGPHARPTSIDWVRDLQRQCAVAGVPFFDKRDVLGETIQEWPR